MTIEVWFVLSCWEMRSGVAGLCCVGVFVYVLEMNKVSFCLRGGFGWESSLLRGCVEREDLVLSCAACSAR